MGQRKSKGVIHRPRFCPNPPTVQGRGEVLDWTSKETTKRRKMTEDGVHDDVDDDNDVGSNDARGLPDDLNENGIDIMKEELLQC